MVINLLLVKGRLGYQESSSVNSQGVWTLFDNAIGFIMDMWKILPEGLLFSIFAAIITSGIISTLIEHHRHRKRERRSVRNLAVRIAHLLENVALDCAGGLEDYRNHCSSNGAIGRNSIKIPDSPTLPEEDSLRLLSPSSLDEIFALSRIKRRADSAAELDRDLGAFDDIGHTLAPYAIQIAFAAAKISQSLRKEYKLKKHALHFGDYTLYDFLKKVECDLK